MAVDRTKAVIGKAVITIGGTDVGLTTRDGVDHVYSEDRVQLQGDQALGDVAEHRFAQSHSFEFTLLEVPLTTLKKFFDFEDAVDGTSLAAKPQATVTEHNVVILGGGPTGKNRRITISKATLMINGNAKYSESQYQTVPVMVKALLDTATNKFFDYEDVDASGTAPTIADYQEVTSGGSESDITDGETDIAVDSDIQVTFSKEIAPGSVSALYFTLITDATGAEVATTVGYGDVGTTSSGSQDRTKVLVSPSSSLATSTTYHLIVKAGIEALDGTTLAAGANLTFTTAA